MIALIKFFGMAIVILIVGMLIASMRISSKFSREEEERIND